MALFGKRKRSEASVEQSLMTVNMMVFGFELDAADGDESKAMGIRDRVFDSNPGMLDRVHDTLASMSHSGRDFSDDATVVEGLRQSGYLDARAQILASEQ